MITGALDCKQLGVCRRIGRSATNTRSPTPSLILWLLLPAEKKCVRRLNPDQQFSPNYS